MLQPAVDYAEKGFPISPIVAKNWRRAFESYKKECHDPMFVPWLRPLLLRVGKHRKQVRSGIHQHFVLRSLMA
ncbi:gamma-glutamyltransferase family protein [Sporolactobacillus sp. CPB3-1]|uniref:Gamma-glutamyltransferase family protein n=1 Tax=Sporolactobacillus mangiferae TaxID=2940498 RepID=A0ABT0M8Q9_9BACL|nr:gamma-glutamyltransferase family protein [Sporolactobacillus mangiferae]